MLTVTTGETKNLRELRWGSSDLNHLESGKEGSGIKQARKNHFMGLRQEGEGGVRLGHRNNKWSCLLWGFCQREKPYTPTTDIP